MQQKVVLAATAITLWSIASLSGCGSGTEPAPTVDRIIWQVDAEASTPIEPAVASGVAYFEVTSEHAVVAIETATGRVLWKTLAGDAGDTYSGYNVIVAGSVVAMGGRSIHGFDRTTGSLIWRFSGPSADEPGRARLVTDGTTIYGASLEGRVHAVDATTGFARWSLDLSEGDIFAEARDPTVSGNELYVGTRHPQHPVHGSLFALDAGTGAVRWRHDFSPQPPRESIFAGCEGHALVLGDAVIVAVEDGQIYAFERSTGRTKWIAPPVTGEGEVLEKETRFIVAAGGGLLVTSLTGAVSLLDPATGQTRWTKRSIPGSILTPPAVLGNTAYVSHQNTFAAYSLTNGAVLWTDPSPPGAGETRFTGGPVTDGSRIFVAGNRAFFALRP